jgi:hypothetical protein
MPAVNNYESIFIEKKLHWIHSSSLSFQLTAYLSVPYIFDTFQPTIFKFWILTEDYQRTNSEAKFLDPLSRSSEIKLGLELSHFWIIFHTFLMINSNDSKVFFLYIFFWNHQILGSNYSHLWLACLQLFIEAQICSILSISVWSFLIVILVLVLKMYQKRNSSYA